MNRAVSRAPFAVRLAPTKAAVEDGRAALMAYLEPCGVDERTLNRVEVALEELVSNVVRHSAEATFVTIHAECSAGTVDITVEDDGAAFDPLGRAEPAKFAKLEDAPLGGLGIALVKRLAKSVCYSREDGRNCVSLRFAP